MLTMADNFIRFIFGRFRNAVVNILTIVRGLNTMLMMWRLEETFALLSDMDDLDDTGVRILDN